MRKEEFERLVKEAAREFAGNKKQPSTPAKQFEKGAVWLWELLMEGHDITYYEQMLREDVMNRLEKLEKWQESLITETARMMTRRDRIESEIERTGDLLTKWDKNMNQYQESNPLHVHLKELDRSIGMQREHLGLSYKVNPQRMKESPKNTVNDDDPAVKFYKSLRK